MPNNNLQRFMDKMNEMGYDLTSQIPNVNNVSLPSWQDKQYASVGTVNQHNQYAIPSLKMQMNSRKKGGYTNSLLGTQGQNL